MTSTASPRSLWTTSQNVFLLDAIASGGMAIGLLAFSGSLSRLFGLPEGLVEWAALILLSFSATLASFALRRPMPASAMWAAVGCNVLWAADSVLLLMSGWVQPTFMGSAFVLVQGVGVGVFALLQSRIARGVA